METISEVFNGIKIKLEFDLPQKNSDFFTTLHVLIENKDGKKATFDFVVMNVHFSTNTFNFGKDRLFYEVIEYICISTETISLEQYYNENKDSDEEDIETYREDHNKMVYLTENINSVVTQDWVDSMNCYVGLQNYNSLWTK